MTPDDPIIVTTTCDQTAPLEQIAEALIERWQAACVQIGSPITSWYRWEGEVQRDREWPCVIKTTRRRFAAVAETVRELHPYDEPQLVATPITEGSQGYLNWLVGQVDERQSDST